MVNYLVLTNTKGNGLWRFKMKIQEVLMKVKWNKRVRSCFSYDWKIKIKHTVCLCYIAYLFWRCVYLKINMSVREWSWRKKRHLQKKCQITAKYWFKICNFYNLLTFAIDVHVRNIDRLLHIYFILKIVALHTFFSYTSIT